MQCPFQLVLYYSNQLSQHSYTFAVQAPPFDIYALNLASAAFQLTTSQIALKYSALRF